jgi:hypothetical protein
MKEIPFDQKNADEEIHFSLIGKSLFFEKSSDIKPIKAIFMGEDFPFFQQFKILSRFTSQKSFDLLFIFRR